MKQIVVLIALLFAFQVNAAVGCIDQNGRAVDWWVILKVPVLSGNADPAAASGYAYSYADIHNPSLSYTGLRLDTDTDGALASTLNQIYNGGSSVGWLMYNDETPSGSTFDSYGHTKGVVGFDSTAGFWLVHSTPRWPNAPPSTYNYPDNEKTYGQSFMCMTFGLATFNDIGHQFLLNKPYVYSSHMTATQNSTLPNMVSVLEKHWITTPSSSIINIVTTGGINLRTFAKNGNLNTTLYESIVEPNLNSGMLIETWQNGSGGKMPSFCTPQYQYDSMNVQQVSLTPSISWSETKDHSKWGISWNIPNWLCIGDINRMYSQDTRGGGTYCFQNSNMYTSFRAIVTGAEYC